MSNHVSKYREKGYTHLDRKKKFNHYEKLIKDPKWVKTHGFYPFIYFEIEFKKFVLNTQTRRKEVKPKVRPIMYAAHVDGYIYTYYSKLVNTLYNEKIQQLNLDSVVTAYRTNKPGKNNIHFAFEVFEFIGQSQNAFIYLGDFSSFFDNLDHQYLKQRLKDVLNCEMLDEGHYSVFKNTTKYSFVKMSDIEKYKGKTKKQMKRDLVYFNTKDLKFFKACSLKKNKNNYGVPQGSPMSAVYSNVYMVEFDKVMNQYVTNLHGMYRRYSDDFIIILPMKKEEIENSKQVEYIKEIERMVCKVPGLKLNSDKSEYYYFNSSGENKLINLRDTKNKLDYLGFTFDGHSVRIREKSLFKYYTRAYSKAKTVKRNNGNSDQWRIKKKLYRIYTHLGRDYGRGNFITYSERAISVFEKSDYFTCEIKQQVKKHWHKINKLIK